MGGSAKPFAVRGFHMPFRPTTAPLSFYLGLMDELAERGYNTVFFSTGSPNFSLLQIPAPGTVQGKGVTDADFQTLIQRVRSRGLEPILEIKLIGKQEHVLGGLAKKLPGLLVRVEGRSSRYQHPIINPNYVLPDGRNVFDAIIFPEIDYVIGLYGDAKPKYLLLGVDEFSVDALDVCAKQIGTTAAALFADTLNRITAHVLARGVTPIIWGDMLLSHRLAEPGHGVEGFTSDPRMKHPQFAYHAEFQSQNNVSVLTAMNGLRNRDRVIVADWHYGPGDPNGEFPSVDYFQKMGFKDVWGTTWYNETGIRNFSRYAARRGCGGMIASTWHALFSKEMKHLLPVIIRNSIVYFKNPGFCPPVHSVPFVIVGEAPLALFPKPLHTITVQASLPSGVTPIDPVLRIQGAFGRLTSLTESIPVTMNYLVDQRRLEAQVKLPSSVNDRLPMMFDTTLEFTCAESGYFVQSRERNRFGIVGEAPPPAGTPPSDALFYADFSGLSSYAMQGKLVYAGGKFGGLIFIEAPKQLAPPSNSALDCRWITAAYAYPPTALWDTIYAGGLRLSIELQVPRGAVVSQSPTLLAYGNFQSGFRVVLGPNHQITLNVARGKDGFSPLAITCPRKVTPGQWTKLEMILSPPDANRQRTVTLRIGDAEPHSATLSLDIVKPSCPLSLGVEFDTQGNLVGSKGKKFPGLIRKVELRPYLIKQ